MSVTVLSTWKVYHISALLDKSVRDILESSGTGAVPGADTEDMLTSATHILVKHEAPTSASQRVVKHHAGRSPILHSRCGMRICCRTAADTGSASGSRHEAGCRMPEPRSSDCGTCWLLYTLWYLAIYHFILRARACTWVEVMLRPIGTAKHDYGPRTPRAAVQER